MKASIATTPKTRRSVAPEGTMADRIINLLAGAKGPMRVRDIAQELSMPAPSTNTTLARMVGEGKLKKAGIGLYDLKERKAEEPAVEPELKKRQNKAMRQAGMGTQIRWKDEEIEALAEGMVNTLMDLPLGPDHDSAVAVYRRTMESPAMRERVRHRTINSVQALKSAGVIEAMGKYWLALMEKVTAPPTVVESVIEVEKVIEMTPEQALAKLPTSDLLVIIGQLLVGRTAPLLQMVDRLENLHHQAIHTLAPHAVIEDQQKVVEEKRRLKIGVLCHFRKHRTEFVAMKSTVGPVFEIIDLMGMNEGRKISIGKTFDIIYVDMGDGAISSVRTSLLRVAKDLGVNTIQCDDWRSMDAQIREDAKPLIEAKRHVNGSH